MDRRIGVILIVLVMEIVFRLSYTAFVIPLSPLLFTLGVRLVEILVILRLAFSSSGVRARSIPREILIGTGVACLLGATVILGDAASRMFLEGGALKLVIAKQKVHDPFLFFLTGCIVAPFAEELFFRGLLYSWLRERMPVIAAVIVSSLLFAGMHGFISPVQLAGGLIFAGLYEWRRNVWAPYVVHAAGNFGIWILPWIYPV